MSVIHAVRDRYNRIELYVAMNVSLTISNSTTLKVALAAAAIAIVAPYAVTFANMF
ncbi:hypothetical protein SDC9_119147 [bioreactor metagenome]|uniref:Uncharacterized protein n=1 Tax=bioreactor metagenome TaxID=1076179 RepID=A0A645C9B5_9ZZZZ